MRKRAGAGSGDWSSHTAFRLLCPPVLPERALAALERSPLFDTWSAYGTHARTHTHTHTRTQTHSHTRTHTRTCTHAHTHTRTHTHVHTRTHAHTHMHAHTHTHTHTRTHTRTRTHTIPRSQIARGHGPHSLPIGDVSGGRHGCVVEVLVLVHPDLCCPAGVTRNETSVLEP